MPEPQASDHDLLLKLHTKLDLLYEEFRRVSNGTGFPRCVERLGRLESAEKAIVAAHRRLDRVQNRAWWAAGLAVTTGITVLATHLAGRLFG